MVNETLATQEEERFLAVIAKDRRDSSFLFIRKGKNVLWCHESQFVQTEKELIEDWQAAKARKENQRVVVATTEISPKARPIWDHIVRNWTVTVPRLALPWSGPCGQEEIPKEGCNPRDA